MKPDKKPLAAKPPANETPDMIYRVSRRSRQAAKNRRKRRWITFGALVLAGLILGGTTAYRLKKHYEQENSYDYQYNSALSAFEQQDYETAYVYVTKAIDLDGLSENAWMLKSKIFLAQHKNDMAAGSLRKLISISPDNTVGYQLLIGLYEEENDLSGIKKLMEECQSQTIREVFSGYLSEMVTAEPDPGDYQTPTSVSLFSDDDCTIYYTTDGSIPDEYSFVYTEPIALEEGVTEITAIAINSKNIRSDKTVYSYSLTLPIPEPPGIQNKSGEYTLATAEPITVDVPEGCTAYYYFDEKPKKNYGKKYTKPVAMPVGEHTFYCIAENQYGKISYASTLEFVLNDGTLAEDADEADDS